MRVGVLALQGDFDAHARALARRGARPHAVRRATDLDGLDGLVLPGGESTTMLTLLRGNGLVEGLVGVVQGGMPVLATCAGVILLAREVSNPHQSSLGVLDAAVERNAYGRQLDSAVSTVRVVARDQLAVDSLEGVFIRAPRVYDVGREVAVLARWNDDPVLVRQGRILAATFHPELSEPSPVVDLFIAGCGGAQ